jgi:dihydroxyacid dehydratase/phosphogluconate dehydratase
MVQDTADISPMANRTPATRVSRATLYLEAAATEKARSNMYLPYHRLVIPIVREADGMTTAATMIAVVQAMALAAPRLAATSAIKRDVLTTTTPNTPSARAAGRTQTTRTTPVRVRGFIDCYIGRSTFTPDPVRAEMSQALFPKPRGKVF